MLDLIIIVFLATGAYSGYKQGLFISILSIVAFIIAIILAFHFMDWGTALLAEKNKWLRKSYSTMNISLLKIRE
jgi:membrane protein required for colicin V production